MFKKITRYTEIINLKFFQTVLILSENSFQNNRKSIFFGVRQRCPIYTILILCVCTKLKVWIFDDRLFSEIGDSKYLEKLYYTHQKFIHYLPFGLIFKDEDGNDLQGDPYVDQLIFSFKKLFS